MKRLAVVAALLATFALPAVAGGLTFPRSVPEGTIDVECAEWRYETDASFGGIDFAGLGNIYPPVGKVTNADVVRALGHVEAAVLEVKAAVSDIEVPTITSATCMDWQEFVVR